MILAGIINTVLLVMHPQLAIRYRKLAGNWPNIAVPVSVNEKYLWRKIIDRNPLFITLSDKLLVKEFCAGHFPQVRTAKVLWTGTDIRTTPAKLLREPGFLKANHASGFNIRLGPDVELPELDDLHATTQGWLRTKWHRYHAEWGYADVQPKLFIEEYLAPTGAALDAGNLDITIYAFGSRVSHIAAMLGHKSGLTHVGRFDEYGTRLAIPTPDNPGKLPPPGQMPPGDVAVLPLEFKLPVDTAAIVELSRSMSRQSDHLRVDFLWDGQDWYLTEVTLYSMGGFIAYSDEELLDNMSDAWELRESWPMNHIRNKAGGNSISTGCTKNSMAVPIEPGCIPSARMPPAAIQYHTANIYLSVSIQFFAHHIGIFKSAFIDAQKGSIADGTRLQRAQFRF